MTTLPYANSPYVGNGPYCYTNTLLSALNRPELTPGTLETLTGSPFGFQLLFGELPLFDPLGWNPGLGLDQALTLLGYTWQTHSFSNENEALAALQEHLKRGPVFVGPVDMGLLKYQPESDRASGADHFVTVLDISGLDITALNESGALVHLHDPQGHPWAALPLSLFLQAWRAEQIGYARPFTLRSDFECSRTVSVAEAVRDLLPLAAQWLGGRDELPVPPGTLGGRPGLERFAEQIEQDFSEERRGMLIQFSIRVGARRKADAAHTLAQFGHQRAATILQTQARILGGLQYPAMTSDTRALAAGLRQLGELHDALYAELLTQLAPGHAASP